MHKKNYKAAGKFIAESRLWPENLGVGKPYSEDIDMRLEDWMDYVCLIQLKKTKEADEMLNRIIQFEPQMIDNTVMNFLPANALATAWAFEQLNRKDEAIPWLNKQIEAFPGSTLLMWSKAMYEQRSDFVLHKNQKDANVRIIEQLINPE
jgi:tetratricopeptide (TPR) repeat protein